MSDSQTGASTTTDQGWGFPGASRKCHYFREDGRALCGKRASIGMPKEMFSPEDGETTTSDCAACRRKLDTQGVK